ncbi:antA/AntB antirepressor family protein [uncultured Ruminococcus sp.]|uniref:antA/AntB antirepressor family protein n=1 Tax=uncultured Ruminococcus sp. TaxID=165186 RepID=UPI00262FF32C|nr:antA/AntB antirepressor family protein [uncultured Ruminococcus sp.]
MNELIRVNYDNPEKPVVSGRELHEALGIKTAYKDWFPRMCEYGFKEGIDFCSFLSESTGGRPATDHMLTIPMAKELCMIQRTDIGRKFRQYFISIEEAWNSPEMVMQRALSIANERVKALQLSVSQLTVDNQIMRPKAEYFDELVDRRLLTNFRDTAKELHIGQKEFIQFLLDHKYVYRDKKSKLKPYMPYVEDGLFELKEFTNAKTGFTNTQTLVTPKGKETFRLFFL